MRLGAGGAGAAVVVCSVCSEVAFCAFAVAAHPQVVITARHANANRYFIEILLNVRN